MKEYKLPDRFKKVSTKYPVYETRLSDNLADADYIVGQKFLSFDILVAAGANPGECEFVSLTRADDGVVYLRVRLKEDAE